MTATEDGAFYITGERAAAALDNLNTNNAPRVFADGRATVGRNASVHKNVTERRTRHISASCGVISFETSQGLENE